MSAADDDQAILLALIEAHSMTSKSVFEKRAMMSAGVDIAAARLTAHGILPRELLDAYVAATGVK